MSGPPPKTTQDRTLTKDTRNPRTEIKILDPAGNRIRAAGLEGRDSTDHATATDELYNDSRKVEFVMHSKGCPKKRRQRLVCCAGRKQIIFQY